MSMKNGRAKPANQIKKEASQGITIEQHLNNVAWALNHGSLTISNAERNAIYGSFNHLKSLLIKEDK